MWERWKGEGPGRGKAGRSGHRREKGEEGKDQKREHVHPRTARKKSAQRATPPHTPPRPPPQSASYNSCTSAKRTRGSLDGSRTWRFHRTHRSSRAGNSLPRSPPLRPFGPESPLESRNRVLRRRQLAGSGYALYALDAACRAQGRMPQPPGSRRSGGSGNTVDGSGIPQRRRCDH